jgi:ATP-binding cassette subfamily D (ALD) long-chain fatty acid import protein
MVKSASEGTESNGETPLHLREFSLNDIRGVIHYGKNGIALNKVPVVTPNGDLLVKDMTFNIEPGMHLLCTGANGVGKSAVMRIISGLWPLFRGSIDRPADKDIIFIPQRPYLSIGTLRDQVIYPHSHADMIKTGRTDEELMHILETVHLDYLPGREGGWDTKKEWKDVFSGGEKQRMNLARLFYHKPKFGVLDECTSAVSTDVEGLMYHRAKEMGVSTFASKVIMFYSI